MSTLMSRFAGLSKEEALSIDAALLALQYWAGQIRACEDAASSGSALTFVCSQTNISGVQAWIKTGSFASTAATCLVSANNFRHQTLECCSVLLARNSEPEDIEMLRSYLLSILLLNRRVFLCM